MSVSVLPEWKQLLLERKRKEEDEREKREQEEEERLASMPAWKRGIIQRRRAKQDGGGEKEREKVREAGKEIKAETVSVEPVWKKSFYCSRNGFTREHERKEEKGNKEEKQQRESSCERMSEEKYNEKEEKRGKWGDKGMQMERTREHGTNESMKEREMDTGRGMKREEKDVFSSIYSIPTIKAENIIIIENRKNEREKEKRDGERETEEGNKRGMRMDLKQFLGGGDKVTEICVSEVLIIKPSIKEERSTDDKNQGNKTLLGVTEKEGKETECKSVRQLISKFGENCKLSCRSKSSDCLIPVEMGGKVRKEERKKRDRKDECGTGESANAFRGVPKRSFSFSEQICKERRVLERSYSDWRQREIEEKVETEKREEERKESEKERVNETHRNSGISTSEGEMKIFREQNKQKIMIKRDKMSRETKKEVKEIQRDRKDREEQTEVQNESVTIVKREDLVTQSMVKFSGEEMKSQSNREERGMSMTWNEAVDHREEELIPRSVFYGLSELNFSSKDRDEMRGVERRLSWKAGRPLTRVESLRERIRQKERRGTEGGDERTREAEMESRQEVALPQSLSQFDVTKEASKEELPVCVPPSLSAEREPSVFTGRNDGVIQAPEKEKQQEEDLLEEDYIPPSQSSSSCSSPSPPPCHTQPAMSRIYNLKPVTSRAGVCITESNLDVQPHSGGLIKIRPGGQLAPAPLKIQTEISSLQSVQRQVEQLHLKEQEVRRQTNQEASQKQNVCESYQNQDVDVQKSQTHTISTPSSESRVQTRLTQISTSTAKSINAQIQPSVTTPSTPLFTIRSASGGPGRRGTTIIITPRKSGSSGLPLSSVTDPKVPLSSVTTPKDPSKTPELSKKRYPTAEEIEVIGGYQNLQRSCLAKNRGSPKMVSGKNLMAV